MIINLRSYIPERHRAACERRYDGPIPAEAIEAGRVHPGTRAYTAEAWRVCKFWARRALIAKRARDLTDLERCEHYLNGALGEYKEAREMERKQP